MHDIAAHPHILQHHGHREDGIDNGQNTQFVRFQFARQYAQLNHLQYRSKTGTAKQPYGLVFKTTHANCSRISASLR